MELKDIEKLIEIVDKSKIDEFEFIKKDDVTRVKLKKNAPNIHLTSSDRIVNELDSIPAQTNQITLQNKQKSAIKEEPREEEKKENIYELKSPVVGTFYSAPSPDADPFVDIGSFVKKGAILCIIEAMKIMNEIEAEISGKVVKILAENAQSVEFGDVLFHIDPANT